MHHLHAWSLDGQINCASLHVVVNEYNEKIKSEVKEELKEHGVSHVTVEIETNLEDCQERSCEIKKVVCHCHHHH